MSNMQSATEDVVMKEGDWLGRWNNRKIAFHNLYVHPDLMKHERKFLKANDKVYVPLCGKSFDRRDNLSSCGGLSEIQDCVL